MKLKGFLFCPKPFYGTITIQKGRIARLSADRPPKRISRLYIPGFVCTHLHSVQTHARNTAENLDLLDWLSRVIWPFEASLNPRTAYDSASAGMKECLQLGMTTILDMATSHHTNSVFEAARDSGIRAFIGKALMDQGPRKLVDLNPLDEVKSHLEHWHGFDKGRIQVTLAPRFVLSCSTALLRRVGEWSREKKLLIHTHASENKRECEWIHKHFGTSNIEVLHKLGNLGPRTILAHGVHLSKTDRHLLKKTHTRISHCPTSNLKLASGIADIRALDSRHLSLGVDGAACNNRLDPFFEMRLAHLLSRALHGLKGVSARHIFSMATLGGANALHHGNVFGSLQLNKDADLLEIEIPELVRFNERFPYESLLHSITAHDIRRVWIRGRAVHTA